MGYRYFRPLLVAHVALLCGNTLLIAWLAVYTTYYATLLILVAVLVGQVAALVRFVDRTNRELGRFLAAVRYADFSQSFAMDRAAGSFGDLGRAFEAVMQRLRDARTEKEEQATYLEALVQHVPIAVIAFDRHTAQVDLFNNAARRLLAVPALRRLTDFAGFGTQFPQQLMDLTPGSQQLLEVSRGEEPLQLHATATELTLSGRMLRIVSLQDIRRQLEDRERAAWQNLMRVLTHEIMNSVTPIASLSNTAAGLLDELSSGPDAPVQLADARDAVATVAERSAGLLRFADSYRRLTRVPAPELQVFPAQTLVDRLARLVAPESARRGVALTTEVTPPGLEVTADLALLEQALLNLIKNAMDAVAGRPRPEIRLRAASGPSGEVTLQVADNGTGMNEAVRRNLFTPFFTTKREGTGVGLALVQQIMRAHQGSVTVSSTPGEGTEVRLRL